MMMNWTKSVKKLFIKEDDVSLPAAEDARIRELGPMVCSGKFGTGRHRFKAAFYERGFAMAWNEYKEGARVHHDFVSLYKDTNKPGSCGRLSIPWGLAAVAFFAMAFVLSYGVLFIPMALCAINASWILVSIQARELVVNEEGVVAASDTYRDFRFALSSKRELKSLFEPLRGKVTEQYDRMMVIQAHHSAESMH